MDTEEHVEREETKLEEEETQTNQTFSGNNDFEEIKEEELNAETVPKGNKTMVFPPDPTSVFWQADQDVQECSHCKTPFTFLNRRVRKIHFS